MKSRMDKYYKDEDVMQRTSKNDALYDALYREKQMPKSNVTVIDNINEIDISKIKTIVDDRESYKRAKRYEKLISPKEIYKSDSIMYEFDEIDDNNYDINEIIKNKRSSRVYNSDPSKVRRITSKEYDLISSFENRSYNNDDYDDLLDSEIKLKELFNTISRTQATDLFSNLKEDVEDIKTNDSEKEETFYTSTSKIEQNDFDFGIEEKNNSAIFIIIGIIAVVAAIIIVLLLK